NGQYGWVEFGRDVSVQPVEWKLRASLSRRALYVLRGGRLVRTIPVGIGAPGSPTPTGHFAVAEKVTGPFGPAYGCCILAMTASRRSSKTTRATSAGTARPAPGSCGRSRPTSS